MAKESNSPSWVAKLALVLTILSFGFGYYQFHDGQRQSRKNAAVDISKTYLQDTENSRRYTLLLAAKPWDSLTQQDQLNQRSFIDLLNYISRLADEDLIDNQYLAFRIKCDIRAAKYYVEKFYNNTDLRHTIKDIVPYVQKGLDAGCPDTPQPH